MTGNNSQQGHDVTRSLLRKIVVTGPCWYEVEGVVALLSRAGYPVCRENTVTPGAEDMVVVVLSAGPELGWWRNQVLLRTLRDAGQYRMVALVPKTLEKAVARQGLCTVMAGDVSLPVLWRRLSAEVRAWHDRRDWRGMPVVGALSVQQARALTGLLSGQVAGRKVEYSHRYLGLARLGFSGGLQYQRYFSGKT